jgi:hypothetical protein
MKWDSQKVPIQSLHEGPSTYGVFLSLNIQERTGGVMLKKIGFKLLVLAAMVSFLFIAQAQTEEQGWKKTITLPSGEVVCDLNGEWDYLWIGQGQMAQQPNIKDVVKITQQGNSFEGIRMIGNWNMAKGTVMIQGELDKNGFKKLIYTGGTAKRPTPTEGKISKDGNKIEMKVFTNFDSEFTRR